MPIIQAIDRALKIVDLFDEQQTELKITEISEQMSLHKSTVHSLLKTLQLHGYIQQDEQNGKYRLGMRFAEKGQLFLNQLDLRDFVRPSLKKLSSLTGQTTHLVTLERNEGLYVDKVEGEKAAIRYSRIGRRVPLYTSAAGKVLVAFQEQPLRQHLVMSITFEQKTEKTILNAKTYEQALEAAIINGYAIDNEENEVGVRCAAVPIFNHNGEIQAAISLSTMLATVGDEELQVFIQQLKQSADEISVKLGYRSK
ncbi:DNA-binding IclR family transcriptional regulator [Paenibacillus endophyticus]|uniref:Glycerol operon regulatory protein n=1 Tax=Paenibacillus endophyticus TaxID=1294268 RepID=A0A7W5CES8_9BACL|nr:IclR family transcriptional regulator [Paenibacillus endophyticus]MBB3155924.1 DNA-binding IclR family transcriptional regulator [Paenibacillus endophyticus]